MQWRVQSFPNSVLFGRDPLVAALLSGLIGAWSAQGALAALGELQASRRDDWWDAEPGKLLHECRRGELASRNRIPFAPAYYGTHDAPCPLLPDALAYLALDRR